MRSSPRRLDGSTTCPLSLGSGDRGGAARACGGCSPRASWPRLVRRAVASMSRSSRRHPASHRRSARSRLRQSISGPPSRSGSAQLPVQAGCAGDTARCPQRADRIGLSVVALARSSGHRSGVFLARAAPERRTLRVRAGRSVHSPGARADARAARGVGALARGVCAGIVLPALDGAAGDHWICPWDGAVVAVCAQRHWEPCSSSGCADRALRPALGPVPRFVALVVAMFVVPLPTLVFIGMEHTAPRGGGRRALRSDCREVWPETNAMRHGRAGMALAFAGNGAALRGIVRRDAVVTALVIGRSRDDRPVVGACGAWCPRALCGVRRMARRTTLAELGADEVGSGPVRVLDRRP